MQESQVGQQRWPCRVEHSGFGEGDRAIRATHLCPVSQSAPAHPYLWLATFPEELLTSGAASWAGLAWHHSGGWDSGSWVQWSKGLCPAGWG